MKETDNKQEKSEKYIPSMSQLRSILSKLPDPYLTLDQTVPIAIDDDEAKKIEFERIIVKKRDGSKSPKWSYKGRIFIDSIAFAVSGCAAIDNVEDDAKRTPIGSVMTGETTDADSYMKRVSERNRAADRDTWRPRSDERF